MMTTIFKDKELHIGETIRVKNTIVEGAKSRIQTYEGMIIAFRGRGDNRTMVVRHIGPQGIGVERIWPVNAPSLVDVEIVRKPSKVRRSKLYFLRDVIGRNASRI